MITIDGHTYFNTQALLDRLTDGIKDTKKEVVFVVGAPLTAPLRDMSPGVADVSGVVQLIRQEFTSNEKTLQELDLQLQASSNKYQSAFTFLQGRRGQDHANGVIRQAVWQANKGAAGESAVVAIKSMSEEQLDTLDKDIGSWHLTPGVEALGELIARRPEVFGGSCITSNFDPLIEVAIKKSGGTAWRTALYADGNLDQSTASGCQVIHLHGYWHGSDTLHTGNQLVQRRPFLKTSLLCQLSNKLVVVMAYGGWRDIFTEALENLISGPSNFPEILWCFYSEAPHPSTELLDMLKPGLNRNRITLYYGIDCNLLLPLLSQRWSSGTEGAPDKGGGAHGGDINSRSSNRGSKEIECDRPPKVEAWVGREDELRSLEISRSQVVVISGIGGEGKSVLAAKYIELIEQGETEFAFWDWRDCREEGDRLRTQILAIIERLSESPSILSSERGNIDADLIQVFAEMCNRISGVFVLDNVDAYVDLERSVFTGLLDGLVRKVFDVYTNCKLIITCRPTIAYDSTSFLSIPIKGISPQDAIDLFSKREALSKTTEEEVFAAHEFTNGHAFWLDLMALQVARVPGVTLKGLLENIRRGRDNVPDLLSPIWTSLATREHTVLRAMAEIKRPETESIIEKIIAGSLTYSKFKRSLKALINLNLIVVKIERNAPDKYDLHPLVRQFVLSKFQKRERVSYIETVLKQTILIIQGMGAVLGVYLPFPMLERWSHKVELEIETGKLQDAIGTLLDVGQALLGGGHIEEYVRISRKLFEVVDWANDPANLKNFDNVLVTMTECLDELEETEDADDLLQKLEDSIPAKTARYIKLCDARCHSLWVRGLYPQAIEWGMRGDDLKKQSHVDTAYDCEHNLALARRDGGEPDTALSTFLSSYDLQDVLDPSWQQNKNGAFYGNIGRCLQYKGDLDDALVCYRKSIAMLEVDESMNRLGNQAYARQWIAEVLHEKGENELALAFYTDAERINEKVAPGRARSIKQAIGKLAREINAANFTQSQAKRRVEQWIRSAG